MKFAAFQKGMQALATETKTSVTFQKDDEKGKYSAHFSDGTTITGNSASSALTVRWNNRQHQARARLNNGRVCAA